MTTCRQVEWNPTGDVWKPADVLEEDTDHAWIKLHENGQVLGVQRRHLRRPADRIIPTIAPARRTT